ncbi:MAG: hypothetical protein ACI9D5_002820, partial [Candidatus Endobugula sp.]
LKSYAVFLLVIGLCNAGARLSWNYGISLQLQLKVGLTLPVGYNKRNGN